jgi:hypothetical protein
MTSRLQRFAIVYCDKFLTSSLWSHVPDISLIFIKNLHDFLRINISDRFFTVSTT